mgnify:CR=1 FL=1
MEIILGLVVLCVVGYFVFFRKPEETVTAPYKVETPVQPVVNNPGVTAVEVALDLEAGAPVVATAAKTKKPRATKAVAEKKPAAKKPAAKKPKAK